MLAVHIRPESNVSDHSMEVPKGQESRSAGRIQKQSLSL